MCLIEKTVAIIDGNSLMHRAYHAIQTPMVAPDGTPTNAVFGFFQMLCKFIEELSPDVVICAFDEGKPVYRIKMMPEYKANRPHMDEELRVQFPVAEELLESMSIPIVKVPGWEGDDILGTLASKCEVFKYKTYLLTGDKDACQLASPFTSIVNTKRGVSDVVILDPEGVKEKYGVTPRQFTDYLGLVGDSSDNIAGVAGIGPKTASSMLARYGSIDGIYRNIDDFTGKKREHLKEGEKSAYLSREIATIRRDLDIRVNVEDLVFPLFDRSTVERAFRKYALSSPLTRVLSLIGAKPKEDTSEALSIDVVLDEVKEEALQMAILEGQNVGVSIVKLGADTLFSEQSVCVFSIESGCTVLETEKALPILRECIISSNVSFFDLKEALRLLYPPNNSEKPFIDTEDLYNVQAFDISLAAYLLDSASANNDVFSLCMKYAGTKPESFDDEKESARVEACCVRFLRSVLEDKLEEDGLTNVYTDIDHPLVSVLVDMERVGVEMDYIKLSSLGVESAKEISALESKIYALAGQEFNINSPKQLGHILFDVLGLPASKKTKMGYSTDSKVLRELSKTSEIATQVIEYRELSKIKSTYIDSLPKMQASDGRIHTCFNQKVTTTGRLSSSDPNLQNIPVRTDFGRHIRECFVPLDSSSVFMSADYSQIELRLLANLSGDRGLIEAFGEGRDFHLSTASTIFGVSLKDVTPTQRMRAKAVNFGIVYGQQAFGLAQSLDISRSEAQDIIDAYFRAYPQVRTYLDDVVEGAREHGFAQTVYGRKRYIPELKSSNAQIRSAGKRNAMNHPMQGSAADIIKMAMTEVQRRLRCEKSGAKLILQVHDELDLSVPEDEIEDVSSMVKDVMENIFIAEVPLIVEVNWGINWACAH